MVSKTINNCAKLEETKKMTFNETKSNYQIVEFGDKKSREEINERVKRGPIKKTDKYKYLGEIVNNKGTHKDSIENKEKKIHGLAKAITKNAEHTGERYGKVVEKLYLTTARPYLTFNMETWSAISRSEMASVEKMQKDVLFKVYETPKSTPYEPFLSEIGIWPMRHYINYKRLLLLYNLINSPTEDRVATKILKVQMDNDTPNCWYSELKEQCEQYEIDMTKVKEITKNAWKKIIRKAITKTFESEEWVNRTKSRFCKNSSRKKYVDETDKNTMKEIMRVRLNMVNMKMNFRNQHKQQDARNAWFVIRQMIRRNIYLSAKR